MTVLLRMNPWMNLSTHLTDTHTQIVTNTNKNKKRNWIFFVLKNVKKKQTNRRHFWYKKERKKKETNYVERSNFSFWIFYFKLKFIEKRITMLCSQTIDFYIRKKKSFLTRSFISNTIYLTMHLITFIQVSRETQTKRKNKLTHIVKRK